MRCNRSKARPNRRDQGETLPKYAAKLRPDASKSDAKGWRSPPVLISVFALAVAILAACVTWGGTITALNRHAAELEKDRRKMEKERLEAEIGRKRTWQSVRAYDIINRGALSAEEWTRLTSDEIKSKCAEEVIAEKGPFISQKTTSSPTS